MCFYNNINTLEKKTPTIIEDNIYTIDVKVNILQFKTNQILVLKNLL